MPPVPKNNKAAGGGIADAIPISVIRAYGWQSTGKARPEDCTSLKIQPRENCRAGVKVPGPAAENIGVRYV